MRSPNEIRMEWGINIGESFVEVEAQCIPIPLLEFGDKKVSPEMRNGRFRQQKDFKPVHFSSNNCFQFSLLLQPHQSYIHILCFIFPIN